MENPRFELRISEGHLQHALRTCSMFGEWPEECLTELSQSARIHGYRRGAQLAAREDQRRDILLVVSGSIEVAAANAAGDKYIQSVLHPGQLTRLMQVLDDVQPRFTYHARESSEIIHIPGEALNRILDARPELWKGVAQFVLRRFYLSVELLHNHALGSVRQRMATMLANLGNRYGEEVPGSSMTELRVSQSDLADMLGVSRQTISKELARLRDEGILGFSAGYRRITLHDIPKLLSVAADG